MFALLWVFGAVFGPFSGSWWGKVSIARWPRPTEVGESAIFGPFPGLGAPSLGLPPNSRGCTSPGWGSIRSLASEFEWAWPPLLDRPVSALGFIAWSHIDWAGRVWGHISIASKPPSRAFGYPPRGGGVPRAARPPPPAPARRRALCRSSLPAWRIGCAWIWHRRHANLPA